MNKRLSWQPAKPTEAQDKPTKAQAEPSKATAEAAKDTAETAKVQAEASKASVDKLPSKPEPRVLHGHTLTKGTTFREICYAIRDSAFVNSDLPIIISFEVHACLEQQQMMVDIIQEAWKGFLVEVPEGTATDKLPKLSELKRKILIKTKSTGLKKKDESGESLESKTTPDGPATEDSEETDTEVDGQQKPVKPPKILEALAKMAVYTRAYHFSHFEQPGMQSEPET